MEYPASGKEGQRSFGTSITSDPVWDFRGGLHGQLFGCAGIQCRRHPYTAPVGLDPGTGQRRPAGPVGAGGQPAGSPGRCGADRRCCAADPAGRRQAGGELAAEPGCPAGRTGPLYILGMGPAVYAVGLCRSHPGRRGPLRRSHRLGGSFAGSGAVGGRHCHWSGGGSGSGNGLGRCAGGSAVQSAGGGSRTVLRASAAAEGLRNPRFPRGGASGAHGTDPAGRSGNIMGGFCVFLSQSSGSCPKSYRNNCKLLLNECGWAFSAKPHHQAKIPGSSKRKTGDFYIYEQFVT